MSELTELRQRYRDGREFSVERDGVTLRLRDLGRLELPGRNELDEHGGHMAVLRRALIGWSGVPAGEIVEGASGELPFDRAFAAGVCDRYPELALEAYLTLAMRLAALEEKRKNSASTSTAS